MTQTKTQAQHTPGPWCFTHIGEKTNGYVVGTAYDENDKQLSGYIPDDVFMDEELLRVGQHIGEHEAATCNYGNARLIAAAPELLQALELCVELLEAIPLTVRDVIESDLLREVSGINPYVMNEGLATGDESYSITPGGLRTLIARAKGGQP